MTRAISGCGVLLTACLVGAAPAPTATVWTVIAIDPRGDGRDQSLPDAGQLAYRYDEPAGMLWFRIALFGRPAVDAFTINIAVDTGAADATRANWWGGHKEFTFDRLITARVMRNNAGYTGTVEISDAAGPREHRLMAIRQNGSRVEVDGDAVLVGFVRGDLSSGTKLNLIASVGADRNVSDDIPSLRSAALDLAAPRPARGLREIDVSRNNLTFGARDTTLADGQPPQVVRHGRSGTSLILVPGVYSGDRAFDGFISRNRSRYAMHHVSPPGLNGTPARPLPPEAASIGEFPWTRRLAQDLLTLIERQRLDRPIIVTHVFPGSLAAEELALNHPDRIGGIVEIASMPVQFAPSFRTPGREAAPDERIAIVDDSWVRHWFKYVTPETWLSNNYPASMFANDPGRAEHARLQSEAAALQVKIRYLVEFMASDHRGHFSRLKVPVLALIPRFDDKTLTDPANVFFKTAFQDAWQGLANSPSLQLETIADARALILDDQPAIADRLIAAFVDKVSRGATR